MSRRRKRVERFAPTVELVDPVLAEKLAKRVARFSTSTDA
jgi:hypothetical protein